jgi:ACS family tartrate transporter-like MFS transporter
MAEVVNESAVDGRALYAKISWRLIPYMFLLYIVAYLDRVNVGLRPLICSVICTSAIPCMGRARGYFFLDMRFAICRAV